MAHRMTRRMTLAAVAILAAAAPARADPILTPIIAGLIASAGLPATLSVFGFTFGTAALATALVTTAIGIGLALAFAPRPRMPPPESGTIAVQQNIPYRIFAYGRCRVAGAIMLKEEVASRLVYVAALNGHAVDGFEGLYLNDDLVTVNPASVAAGDFVVGTRYTISSVGTTDFVAIGASANTVGVDFVATGAGSGSGAATATDLISGYVASGADGRYGANAVRIDTRQGLPTETAYGFITSLLAAWDSAHRGDGQASLGMLCLGVSARDFSKIYPYVAPAPSVIERGYRVYDPRDPAQHYDDPSTFQWSQNPALCILHFLCFSSFGFREDYANAILPFVDFWKGAADICDESVALQSGGTEPRYRLGGWTTTEQARIATLTVMLQCCDGFLSRRGGGYVLFVGKYAAPTVTLTDADIVAFYIQSNVSTEDKVNEAVAYWSDPDTGYISVQTDPVRDLADQAARGGAPRKAQMQLTWVQSVGQASRLLKREMFRQRTAVRGTITFGWSGLNAAFERWIAIDSNSIPRLSGAVIENRRPVINAKTRTVTLDFLLSGPEIDDYDPATDESGPPTIAQRPTTVGLPIPSTVAVVPELFTDATGASSVILAVAWDQPFFNGVPWAVDYQVRWRLTDAGAGSPGPWTAQAFDDPTVGGGRVSVQTGVVQSGTSLDVQVASVGTGASLSTWSATVTVSTALADVAPQPPIWTSAVGASGHADLTAVAPPSPNFASAQFYRAASGAPFSSAVAIGSPVAGSPGSTLTYTDTVAVGTYDYFVVSLTAAPVSSAPAGPLSAVVT